MTWSIGEAEFFDFLSHLSKRYELIAPVERNGRIAFEMIEEFEALELQRKSHYPPTRLFLPFEEVLLEFKRNRVVQRIEKRPRALLGIKPCEVHALMRLDKLFLDEVRDPYYGARRQSTLLLVTACLPDESCFCSTLGTNTLTQGFDLFLAKAKDGFVVEVGSAKGKRLLKLGQFRPSQEKPKWPSAPRQFKVECLDELWKCFNDAIWQQLNSCLCCGACTAVCPTCHCFDLLDFPKGKKVERKRVRVYCLSRDFSQIFPLAKGHVYRQCRYERLRHFIYHKFCYFKQWYGMTLCVGCGRCLQVCPIKLDVLKLLSSL